MAKKQAARHVEPEENRRKTSDVEPEPFIDEDDAPRGGASGASKTDLIREAVKAGHTKPANGVAYISDKHGVDIDSKYFSIVKSKFGKSGEKLSSTPVAAAPRKVTTSSAAAASSGAVPTSLLDDLKHLRDIKDRYGDDFQKIVDAIG